MLEVKNVGYTVLDQIGNQTNFKLSDIEFTLMEGYFMCILGENGSGKSTLLQLIYGMMPSNTGKITYEGEDVLEHSDTIRQKIAYISSESFFLEDYSLYTNITLFSTLYPKFQSQVFDKYFAIFGFESMQKTQLWKSFSSGERVLIQTAFSFARQAKLFLFDEPMANLDPVLRMQFLEVLQDLIAKEFICVVMVTHVFDEVEQVSDYILFLQQGKMLFCGEKDSILQNKEKQNLAELFMEYENEKSEV